MCHGQWLGMSMELISLCRWRCFLHNTHSYILYNVEYVARTHVLGKLERQKRRWEVHVAT